MNDVWIHFDHLGNIIAQGELPTPPQMPLRDTALVATLNAVLGIWTLQEAANVAQLPEQALVNEAQAWAVAQENNNV